MFDYFALRMIVRHVTPSGRQESISTTVIVSASEKAAGAHFEEARFRASVRGATVVSDIVVDGEVPCARPHVPSGLRSRPWRSAV